MKVAICIPSHGSSFRKHERCLAELRYKTGWPALPLDDFPSLHIGRAILAQKAIELEADVSLWLDSDTTFRTAEVVEIVKQAYERVAIVGALYLGKAFGSRAMARYLPGTAAFGCYESGSVLEVEGIGFGVTAVHTEVFTKTRDKLGMNPLSLLDGTGREFVPWFSTDLAGEAFHSADYAFTERARRAGYKVFADTRARVGHLGEHEFMLEDSCVVLPRVSSVVIDPT